MKFLFSFLPLVFLLQVRSQSIANYTTVRNTGVTYNSISVTGNSFASWRNNTSNTQDDNRSNLTDIGFDFWYNGVRYNRFSVSTNGFLDFSASTDDGGPQADDFGYSNAAFTTANAANATRPAIAPFYDDLTAQGGTAALGNSIKYLLIGSAPNRTLVVEWINMAVFGNVSPSLNFQVQLVETTGQIIVHYGSMNGGTNNFSYTMGLNGPVVSASPTAAQLKVLQSVNTNNFSNTVQNNLSAMPTAASRYIFSSNAPTAVSGTLTFSGVSQTAMTLNWPNWANNEVGYVIYNSTDGVNYNFVTQTAANANSATITGLLPSTNYFWRLYAVTEGHLSSPLTGTQITGTAGNKVSIASGSWNNANIWTPTGVPGVADNVTIANGHVVTIPANGQCNDLQVGQGTACTLHFSGGTARTLQVNNNITILNQAVFSTAVNSNATHTINVEGNIINNGTLNFAPDGNSLVNVIFATNGNQSVSGTGAVTNFNRINMNLGNSSSNILEISTSNFFAASNFLDLLSGTFKISTGNVVNITPFTGAKTITSTMGLWLNSPNLTVNTGASVDLLGSLTISSGTLNVGNAANEDLVSNGGVVDISGGLLSIAGKLDGSGINNTCDFNISGGMVIVPAVGSTNTSIAPFHISGAGSQCNMTGGVIVIAREGGSGAQNLGFINTGTSGAIVTGGTLQIGNASTPAAQIIDINTDSQVQNLSVNSANATARLITNSLTVAEDVTIAAGTFNVNNLNVRVGGNWNNSGTFTPGTATVFFDGNTAQSISRTGGETFNALGFSGTGIKTFSSSITANSHFTISSGASVDVSPSNFSVTVRGNFLNSGNFNARTGLINLNGTSAQTIGGSSTTTFYDLTLNNNAGASLSNAENLRGSLTLSNGTFNANGQIFTLLSDANGTGRIAQITGSGDYLGNITIQRFAPGGSTGWALLGSPISSALTLNDWDDDIYISCSTCPDGTAAGFLSVYSYNETAPGIYDSPASYVALTGINDPIVAGRGYWVYLGTGLNTTTDITLDLTGTPRKFNYTIPLNYTNTGSVADDGWNLITNPYPSAISWSALRGSTSNLDNAIYVYNADLNAGSGGFASFVNGISSPAVASGGIGNTIAMGQGFYVHSTGATGINAQESNKIAGNPTFLKPSSSSPSSLVRLTLNGLGREDETVLYTEPLAHDYFDKAYDSYKMRGQDPSAPFIALEYGNDALQISGIAPVSGTYTTALKTLTGYNGTYTIAANGINSFPKGACIHLYDKFTATSTDLRNSNYVFQLSDTTTVSRFMLSITINSLSVNASMSQPSCQQPAQGQIVAIGNSAGPWNYQWSSNGIVVKTSLNKTSADTLSGLSGGNYDLIVNTVGMCDHEETVYAIVPQIPVNAAFSSNQDTVYLDVNPTVQFTSLSSNVNSYFWNFGTGLDFASTASPQFAYPSPGNYSVSLMVSSSTGCSDTAYKTITVLSKMVGLTALNTTQADFTLKTVTNNQYQLAAQFNSDTHFHIRLTDASGKLIKDYGDWNGKELQLDIDLDGNSKGVYFLSLLSENGKKVVKLMVQ